MIAPRNDWGEKGFVGTVVDVFSETGLLSESPDFEYRAEQQALAVAVARALEEEKPVLAEAGTGVGKSLAYLVPCALFASAYKRKALISTHTINLQEQLVRKDIPIVQKLFPDRVRAVLLKGRNNYICPGRLKRAMQSGRDLFTSSEAAELKLLWEWGEKTRDGTLSDLDFSPSPKVWSQVCSEAHVCTSKRCGPTGRCFYQEVRKRVGEADIVVLNHTLFFTLVSQLEDFGIGEEGFLFPGDFVVFDEAHTLENVAARQLGLSVSHSGMRFDIQRLFNPKTKKGLFQFAGDINGVRETGALLDKVAGFFQDVTDGCFFQGVAREFRVREPGLVEDTVSAQLLKVQSLAMEVAESEENETTKLELQEMARRLRDARFALADFLDQSRDGHVYWVEQTGVDRSGIALQAAPVDVAQLLRPLLFGEGKLSVLTSATLGTGKETGDLSYFQRRVGAEDVRALQIGSPFNFPEQMKLYVVRSMPDPSSGEYGGALQSWIAHFLVESSGRAFVLFTSYKQMHAVAEGVRRFMEGRGWTLLVQGAGAPRHRLIETFKEDVSSVLFGTDSFWTGVDVPGEALSNVIVTRLPFAVPDHPLTASRLECIEEEGRNPFIEYSVPEAVLKLRQGVGRLIRSTGDRGIAVILDKRVLTKAYGRSFLDALPVSPEIVEGEGYPIS